MAKELLSLGISGYVLKSEAFDDLVTAIDTVTLGEQFISAGIAEDILSITKIRGTTNLTEREQEVLQCISVGNSNKEVARILGITERTVRFHVSSCFIKLEVKDRTEAVTVALSRHLINLVD